MREYVVIKNSPWGKFSAMESTGFDPGKIQKFQDELRGNILRKILRKLKIAFCGHSHEQIVPIFRTKHYSTTSNFRFWRDCIIGVVCCNCGKIILLDLPFDIGNINHLGFFYSSEKPNFTEID